MLREEAKPGRDSLKKNTPVYADSLIQRIVSRIAPKRRASNAPRFFLTRGYPFRSSKTKRGFGLKNPSIDALTAAFL
jgi:hypothetical protein